MFQCLCPYSWWPQSVSLTSCASEECVLRTVDIWRNSPSMGHVPFASALVSLSDPRTGQQPPVIPQGCLLAARVVVSQNVSLTRTHTPGPRWGRTLPVLNFPVGRGPRSVGRSQVRSSFQAPPYHSVLR